MAPDKSLSHRALVFGALAEGTSEIKNLLQGEDVLNTLAILQRLGVSVGSGPECLDPRGSLRLRGLGLKGLRESGQVLYCGNSGTTMRLMLGVLSGSNLAAGLTGDASLNKRPMDRVTDPLTRMGARFETVQEQGKRLVKTLKHPGLKSFHYDSPVASAQVKSSILLAGLCAGVSVSVTEPYVSRDHTENLLRTMGADLHVSGTTVSLEPVKRLHAMDFEIPGDISSAAFFIVAALICPESDILIENVNLNPTRTGILDVLAGMGADITIQNERILCGEKAGDLAVRSSRLKNVKVGGSLIPRLIDEIPVLALAAACAEGEFVLSDARELRVKETDRIKAIVAELGKLGVDLVESEDGLMIRGGNSLKVLSEKMCSYGDHRMAMMLSVAKLVADRDFEIDDVDCISTSFPGFFNVMRLLQ